MFIINQIFYIKTRIIFHYIDKLKTEWDLDIMNMIRHPLKALGVIDYVNFITFTI